MFPAYNRRAQDYREGRTFLTNLSEQRSRKQNGSSGGSCLNSVSTEPGSSHPQTQSVAILGSRSSALRTYSRVTSERTRTLPNLFPLSRVLYLFFSANGRTSGGVPNMAASRRTETNTFFNIETSVCVCVQEAVCAAPPSTCFSSPFKRNFIDTKLKNSRYQSLSFISSA